MPFNLTEDVVPEKTPRPAPGKTPSASELYGAMETINPEDFVGLTHKGAKRGTVTTDEGPDEEKK